MSSVVCARREAGGAGGDVPQRRREQGAIGGMNGQVGNGMYQATRRAEPSVTQKGAAE